MWRNDKGNERSLPYNFSNSQVRTFIFYCEFRWENRTLFSKHLEIQLKKKSDLKITKSNVAKNTTAIFIFLRRSFFFLRNQLLINLLASSSYYLWCNTHKGKVNLCTILGKWEPDLQGHVNITTKNKNNINNKMYLQWHHHKTCSMLWRT